MRPEAAKATYRRMLQSMGETVIVRRVGANGGPDVDAEALARVTGFDPSEVVGDIDQADRKVILLAEDLVDAGWPVPPRRDADVIVWQGRELVVKDVDDATRRVAGVLIAYEIRAVSL